MSPSSSESRIIWSSPVEHTTLYNFESHSIYAMPRLSYKGRDPIAISVARTDSPEDDLYVMSAGTCYTGFQVLRFGGTSNSTVDLFPNLPEVWQLESLPQPPLPEGTIICSHALLHGGRTICITAAPYGTSGTYLFDTVEREWSQAPDGWDLPFSSGAEHIHDLKLWLGLCTSNHHLCASSDLSAAVDEGKLPTIKHKWEVLQIPEEWLATKVSLINLGEGRFCVFKLIHDVPDKSGFDDYSARGNMGKQLALLTGVEIISSPGEEEDLIEMVPHKSLSYNFGKESVNWVL
jgi:hypothetical protein